MRILLLLAFGVSSLAKADILEERISLGGQSLVPSPFVLNPAQNLTSLKIFGALHHKQDKTQEFKLNPGGNQADVKQNITQKDIALGGQYPLGGASIGGQYSEQRRTVNARHSNRNQDNNELFVGRDYRVNFVVDFLPQLRGGFTFHRTALQAELNGNFFIGDDDHTRYKGSVSGYGLGLNYGINNLNIGAYSHAPMRGKAMVEGEQKIVTEPGLYGLNFQFRAKERLNLGFYINRWSYKHDERDDEATSPVDQQNISLRGIDMEQFYRKTMSYTLSGEYFVTPLVAAKAALLQQDGVFLFDGDKVPGDDKSIESRMRYRVWKVGAAIQSRAFIAELGLTYHSADQGSFKDGSRFGNLGDYTSKGTGALLMIGGAL